MSDNVNAIQTKVYNNSFRDGLSGAAAGVLSDILFYGLDSYKIQNQSGSKIKLSNLFRGVIPVSLIGTAPSFGLFFTLYHPIKRFIDLLQTNSPNQALSVCVASVLSIIPSSIIGVPGDVIKKRIILGNSDNPGNKITLLIKKNGIQGLFLGWKANLIKDVPFAGLKMSLYEFSARNYFHFKNEKHRVALGADALSSNEAGIVGFISGFFTSVLTTPLDCVNTRIKSGELAKFGVMKAHSEIVKRDGLSALFRGVVPRTIIIGFGSTVFWYLYRKTREILEKLL